jgi:uncharacterized protein YxjI
VVKFDRSIIFVTFQSDIYSESLLDELEIASKSKLENRYNLFKHRAAIVDGNSLENRIIKKYFLIYKTYAVVSATQRESSANSAQNGTLRAYYEIYFSHPFC